MCASNSKISISLLLAALLVTPALAADKKADPSKGEVRRLQQVQRQLEQEKTQLSEQKAAAESELGAVRKKVDGEARRAAALSRDVGALRAARDTASAKLAATEGELRKAQEAQRAAEAESKRLLVALNAEKQQLSVCTEQGQELRKTSNEVLSLYEKKTCRDSTLQGEPFTGLKRVEIENAVEDMRERLNSPRAGS